MHIRISVYFWAGFFFFVILENILFLEVLQVQEIPTSCLLHFFFLCSRDCFVFANTNATIGTSVSNIILIFGLLDQYALNMHLRIV